NVEERLTVATELVQLGERAGEPELELQGRHWRIADLLELGELATLDAEMETYARLAEEQRQPFYRWDAALRRAMRAELAGRLAEVEQLIEEALALGQRAQRPDAALPYSAQLFILRADQGRVGEMESSFRQAAARSDTITIYRCALAAIYVEEGDEAEATH